jgi:hypothetical protein
LPQGFTEEDRTRQITIILQAQTATAFPGMQTAVKYLVGNSSALDNPAWIPFIFFRLKNSMNDTVSADQSPAVLARLICPGDHFQRGMARSNSPSVLSCIPATLIRSVSVFGKPVCADKHAKIHFLAATETSDCEVIASPADLARRLLRQRAGSYSYRFSSKAFSCSGNLSRATPSGDGVLVDTLVSDVISQLPAIIKAVESIA